MKEKGLTLIEVLITMGIVIIVGALLVVILVNSAGIFTQQSSKVAEGLNTNDALSIVRSSIKQANVVTAVYTSGSTTYTSGTNQLVLKVASVDSSNNIISGTFDYFIFFLDQNYFHFKIFPDPASFRKPADRILSTNVSNLGFQFLSSANPPVEVSPAAATKVRITLALMQKVGIQFETSIATSEANLRND